MRAMVIHRHGGPDELRHEDRPVPRPGDDDLLVEVHATSVNPVDAKIRHGGGAPRTFPLTLGFDASGVVAACGARVRGFAPGDEVFGCPHLFKEGANAEYVLLDHRAVGRKPASVDHATAAALPLVGLTAWEALHDRARIAAGQTILIHAGAGGVGHVAVQLARLAGCRVVTTAGRPESIAFCRDTLGADETIDHARDDFTARVRELTGGRGLPVVLDTVGGDVFRRSIDCVAPLGQLVTILGDSAGDRGPQLLYRSITVHHEFMGARLAYDVDPAHQGAILTSLARLVDRGLLRPHVGARLPLAEVAEAHRRIETGRTIGKIVVTVR
jgi:NADPH2:quinone reductase